MITLINASAHDTGLDALSVHCIVTSPPYWGLRAYAGEQRIEWPAVEYSPMPGLPALSIPAMTCGLGEETTPEAYIGHMILVMREMWRVLRDDGTCWVNLGDSYNNFRVSTNGQSVHNGEQRDKPAGRRAVSHNLKEKDLCLIPARFALAAQADGWYIRNDIIWAKPNPMPESVTDRCTKAHEYVWLMAKSQRYFYDAEAVKEEGSDNEATKARNCRSDVGLVGTRGLYGTREGQSGAGGYERTPNTTRSRRSVWNIATSPYSGAHFATWPPKLVAPMILAGTSARGVCPACGAPWERVVEKEWVKHPNGLGNGTETKDLQQHQRGETSAFRTGGSNTSTTTGWRPTCECPAADPIPATVLDPFNGSGTSGTVALDLGRAYIGVDISTEYVTELAEERIGGTQIGFGL